ncbi:MAG: histidine kinase [Prolixibacteraceae bacterium]|nr:histidine kinase [Prolixibacteraceae bacterium]
MIKSLRLIKWHGLINMLSLKWVVALIPTIVIIILLPNHFQKYYVQHTITRSVDKENLNQYDYYHDLNGNGIKEKLQVKNFYGKFGCCIVDKEATETQRQFNFYGKITDESLLSLPIYSDINNDGFDEVFVFTQKKDSIFLNGFDYYNNEEVLYGRFITTVGIGNGKYDYMIENIAGYDRNNDRIPEIYFSITGNFALYPRRLFAYDIANDSLISSINTGANFIDPGTIVTDTCLTIFIMSSASENCDSDFPYPYPDTCAWIFGFNKDLELSFNPIQIPGRGSRFLGNQILNNTCYYIEQATRSDSTINQLKGINSKGEEQLTISLPNPTQLSENYLQNQNIGHLQLGITKDDIQYYTTFNFKKNIIEDRRNLKVLENLHIRPFYVNNKYNGYFGISIQSPTFFVIFDNLKQKVELPHYFVGVRTRYIETRIIKNGFQLLVANNDFIFGYNITANKFFPIRYIIYVLIYLLSVGFVYVTQLLQKQQSSKREKLQKQIEALQLQLVNSQLDPHFTFNSINTVSSKILKGEKLEAYDLMTSFSRMMRSAMLFSNKAYWSLKEEFQFTEDYLTFMEQRFPETFDFCFTIDHTIISEKINTPRLLIQNFAENAVKHAFNGIDYKGQIEISLQKEREQIFVMVTDNGIGREQGRINAEKSPMKSGKGLKLIQQQVEIYNRLYNAEIKIEISDNMKAGHCGTKITILGFG